LSATVDYTITGLRQLGERRPNRRLVDTGTISLMLVESVLVGEVLVRDRNEQREKGKESQNLDRLERDSDDRGTSLNFLQWAARPGGALHGHVVA
jgi:hypothetical protein